MRPTGPQRRLLSEADIGVRSASRNLNDPEQFSKYVAAMARSGQLDEDRISILAGLGVEPAIYHMHTIRPPHSITSSSNYEYRRGWNDFYKIEIALEEGGKLGYDLAKQIFKILLKKCRSLLMDIQMGIGAEVTEAIDTFLREESLPSSVVDSLIQRVRQSAWSDNDDDWILQQSSQLRETLHAILNILGMANTFYLHGAPNPPSVRDDATMFYLVGNAINVFNKDLGSDIAELRQWIIKQVLGY